jgi:hypothetical protein
VGSRNTAGDSKAGRRATHSHEPEPTVPSTPPATKTTPATTTCVTPAPPRRRPRLQEGESECGIEGVVQKIVMCDNGHIRMTTRPTISEPDMGPKTRLSDEKGRLSPITK